MRQILIKKYSKATFCSKQECKTVQSFIEGNCWGIHNTLLLSSTFNENPIWAAEDQYGGLFSTNSISYKI